MPQTKTVILVWTRRDWKAGPEQDNFREQDFTGTRQEIVEALNNGEDVEFEKLGARSGSTWLSL